MPSTVVTLPDSYAGSEMMPSSKAGSFSIEEGDPFFVSNAEASKCATGILWAFAIEAAAALGIYGACQLLHAIL